MWWWGRLKERIRNWVRDYDSLQQAALLLLYIQIGCALIGSLGASYNGVLVINLAIALFALVAIESSSQSLARTYALLLFSALLLDLSWFILFSRDIWNISSDTYGIFYIFSVKLTLAMQILGFSVRLSSSFLWIQIYRLGASYIACPAPPRDPDSDFRNSFLSPPTPAAIATHSSDSDLVLGGSIYDPPYFSSLFEDSQASSTSFNAVPILFFPSLSSPSTFSIISFFFFCCLIRYARNCTGDLNELIIILFSQLRNYPGSIYLNNRDLNKLLLRIWVSFLAQCTCMFAYSLDFSIQI